MVCRNSYHPNSAVLSTDNKLHFSRIFYLEAARGFIIELGIDGAGVPGLYLK